MRHVIKLDVTKYDDDGLYIGGYRIHIITLNNKEAEDRVIEAIQCGQAWDGEVKRGDILSFNPALDCSL